LQGPAAIPVTVVPVTEQVAGVVGLNVTVNPELAVALNVPLPPTATEGAAVNVIVWPPAPTVTVWVTCGAAL